MSKKTKISYICTTCETTYSVWQGKCNTCGEWNTIVKNTFGVETSSNLNESDLITYKIQNKTLENSRLLTPINKFNEFLNGGIVPGQVMLLAGEPGVGKSTLLSQLGLDSQLKTLYISGEESLDQISKRAMRLGNEKQFENTEFSNNTNLEYILGQIDSGKFNLIIIDSIQTVYSTELDGFPGSMNQMRESATKITSHAKNRNVAIIIIGQITKEGYVAGPKIIEHTVDTVIYFEGDTKSNYRILRVSKNRFGRTNEILIFEMREKGLEVVENPELYFVDNIEDHNPEGVALSVIEEGKQPLVIEVQALCASTSFSFPKRVSNGYDTKRVEMLIAVLKKKLKLKLDNYDIFVNIIGGLKIKNPEIDLAVCGAIISSLKSKPLPANSLFIGEVSLTGQIRKSRNINANLKIKNFKNIFSSENTKSISEIFGKLFNS